ncbi:tripartite tricarboxylate transporter substrate binding protein [Ferrovibrio terrae]|uniref:Bug family tripartite tricarboxylate transporter substrate binding protein n=1 Tax=Ferrovibrio terrae TaxID=2594003 RepID=UPI003137A8BD
MTGGVLPTGHWLRRAGGLLWCLAGILAVTPAYSADYPTKPITLVVPFTPGGTTDILAREIAHRLQVDLGQTVLIENRAGAGGGLGAEIVARASPDGHTLLMGHIGTLALNPSLYPKLGYDPIRSFAPVALVARVPNILVVNAKSPINTLAELVAAAKARPGSLAYGSGGNGSAAHITTEYLKHVSGVDLLHVPYKGTAPFVTDLIADQIQVGFTGATAVMPQVKAGRLRALAISSARRMRAFPELPTVAESGYAGFDADQWYGIVAPAGTPAAVIARLNATINSALLSPQLQARLDQEGAEAAPASPEKFGSYIAEEIARWRPILKAADVRID